MVVRLLVSRGFLLPAGTDALRSRQRRVIGGDGGPSAGGIATRDNGDIGPWEDWVDMADNDDDVRTAAETPPALALASATRRRKDQGPRSNKRDVGVVGTD